MTQHEEWTKWLDKEMSKPYFQKIYEKELRRLKEVDLTPQKEYWFSALQFPDMEKINVIFIGNQNNVDAYAADGFAFSSIDEPDRETYLLYKKLEEELGVFYNQEDNTKTRWLEQGILCYPFCLTATSGHLKYTSQDWIRFSTAVLLHWLNYKRPMAFVFLDKYTPKIEGFLWDKSKLPHLIIRCNINGERFKSTPIFKPVTHFVKETYGYDINWI